MCGIAGIVCLSPDARVNPDELRAMADALRHRGPDAEGYYVDPRGRCGLAFRRLSIIDLATGNQPIANARAGVTAVFNGEIYNFRSLRADLERRGHAFHTQGDAEAIVHAFEEHGADTWPLLHGMFAIALWDGPRGELWLARDRFGKKPLTYAVHDGRLYFASEAKAILALPHVPRVLDPQSLHRYLLFQYVPAPHSIYRGFGKLLPGHAMRVRAGESNELQQRAFWRPPQFATDDNDSGTVRDAREAARALETQLIRAVEKRLISDVPLGAFLSGGLDSSLVVALMHRLGVSPLRTFSIGFDDARYDETSYARLVAAHFETEHHEQRVTPDATDVLDTLAHHYDEPFGDSSAIPTYYVSRYTRQFVTVALTGDGGDEAFAGYDRYFAARAAARVDWLPRSLRAAVSSLAQGIPHGRPKSRFNRAYRFLSAMKDSGARRYLSWVNVFSPELLTAYRDDWRQRLNFDEPLAWFDGLYAAGTGDALARANHADLQSYLPYDLLTKVDIASMACSLECRCPLLDHELFAFAADLPPRHRVGKRLLRDVAATMLPLGVLNRPKMGFGVPVGQWFRGPLAGLIRDRLLRPEALAQRIFCGDWLRALLDSHLSGRATHEHRLWALLMLELWAEHWGATVD